MTKVDIKDPVRASRLCVDCGLCCSGVLFDAAKLDPEESELAQDIGLDVLTSPNGKVRFALPCKYLCGTACSRYEKTRPNVCGNFFCKLVVTMDRGEISESEARQHVEEVQKLLARIKPLLRPDETIPQARARWRKGAGDPVATRQDPELFVLMAGLGLMLDRHFRRAGKETLQLL